MVEVKLTINDQQESVVLDARDSLSDLLRGHCRAFAPGQ